VVLLKAGNIPDPVSTAPGGAEIVLAVVTPRSAGCVASDIHIKAQLKRIFAGRAFCSRNMVKDQA